MNMVRLLCVLVLTFVIFSCNNSSYTSVYTSSTYKTDTNISEERLDLLQFAVKFNGIKYKYASVDPKQGFDCSGFTHFVYNNTMEKKLPRVSRDQAKTGKRVSMEDAQPGDLLFYAREGRVFHVSLITNVGFEKIEVIHSTTSRGVIRENILKSSYWYPKISHIQNVID